MSATAAPTGSTAAPTPARSTPARAQTTSSASWAATPSNGEAGNDILVPGHSPTGDGNDGNDGNDTLDGGEGRDVGDYTARTGTQPLTLHLDGTAGGAPGEGDTLAAIEILYAGGGNDTLFGDALANTLDGRGGNDVLTGGAGKDSLFGKDGDDELHSVGDGAARRRQLRRGRRRA